MNVVELNWRLLDVVCFMEHVSMMWCKCIGLEVMTSTITGLTLYLVVGGSSKYVLASATRGTVMIDSVFSGLAQCPLRWPLQFSYLSINTKQAFQNLILCHKRVSNTKTGHLCAQKLYGHAWIHFLYKFTGRIPGHHRWKWNCWAINMLRTLLASEGDMVMPLTAFCFKLLAFLCIPIIFSSDRTLCCSCSGRLCRRTINAWFCKMKILVHNTELLQSQDQNIFAASKRKGLISCIH